MAIIELEGLKGLKGLNKENRQAWYEKQVEAGKVNDKTPIKQLEVLYDNQKYIEKYGLDAFESKSYEERMQQWKDDIVEDAFYKAYNPFLNDDESSTGPKGVLLDSSKGLGEDWYKYDSMDSDSKIKLLESGYKTPSEMNKIIEEHKKALDTAYANIPNSFMKPAYGTFAEPISESVEVKRNDKILEKIYNEDLKKKREELAPLEQKFYEEAILNLFDDDVASRFMEAIKPKEGPAYIYSAYFNDDGTSSSSETKDFSIDDMRHFLAKKFIYDYYLGSTVGYDALNNEGKEYLNKHQTKSTYAALLAKDIGISALSYTADKWNGLRRATLIGQTADVYITNDGEVVPTKDVKFNGKQPVYTKDDKTVPVHKENLSLIALDDMGKDENGEDKVGFNNAQYWTNAEQFGTLDSEEQAQYKKLGFSPYKVVYKPGDESDIIYESLKMTSFALADMASNAIPMLATTAGANMVAKAGQAASIMAKGMSATGKLLYGTGRVSAALNPSVAAIGIGNAYGRGVYGETFAQNMQQLEQSMYDQAQKSIKNSYDTNPEYKKYFDAKVEEAENELKSDYTNLTPEKLENPAVLRQQAMQKVIQDESKTWVDSFKNTKNYGDALQNIAESASNAALASSITTAAKYVGVNYGWRRFLFKNPKKLASSYEKKEIKGIEEVTTDTGNKRLASKFDFSTKKEQWGEVAKIAGTQAWGGAWTNGTDELQSGGGRQINEDRVSQYLQGLYNGKAKETQYTALNAVASYLHGAALTLGTENPWRAGLVGGLGSLSSAAFNTMSLSQLLTKEGRRQFKEQWNNSNLFGKANMLVSNGILNEYYAKKEGQKQLRAKVDFINKLLDGTNDFENLYQALALDMASVDATNPEDANAIQYLKGVQIMDLLHKFNENKESAKIGMQSTVMEKAMTTIQKLSDPSKLTQEEREDYLSQYYAENPGIPQSEAENENAFKVMQERAKRLQDSYETYRSIEEVLGKVESERGRKLPDAVRGRLIKRLTFDRFLTDRTVELEEKITGMPGRDPIFIETAIESYGTEKAIIERVEATKNNLKALDEWITEAEEKFKKAEKELSDYNTTTEKKDPEKLKKLQTAIDNAKIDAEYLKTMKRDLGLQLDKLVSDGKVKTSNRVLTAKEILMLNAQNRARMLDKENYENYSDEQQKEIDKLKNDLTSKDPSLLNDIQNLAWLSRKVEANRRSFTLMLENPEAAAYQVESNDNREALEAQAIYYERLAFNHEQILDLWLSVDEKNGVPLEKTKHDIYKSLRTLKKPFLKYLKRSDSDTFKNLEKEIDDAIAWTDLVENINDITKNIAGYEKIKKDIDKILDKSDTAEDILNELSRKVTDSHVHVSKKIAYNKLLEDLESVLNQKAATTKEDREASLERAKERAKKREDKKRKIKEAEEKAKEETKKETKSEAEKKVEETAKFNIDEEKDSDTSNDEAAKAALHNLDDKDFAKSNEESIKEDEIEEIKKETKNVDLGDIDYLESPTMDEQVASVDEAKVVSMPEATSTDEDGAIIESPSDSFLGNMFYGYEVDHLKKDGTLVKRKSTNKNKDISSWLEKNEIRLQEIIDNELDDIKKTDPKVFPLYVTSIKQKDIDFAVEDFIFLSVEYTSEIQEIHKENLGGVVTANGKQYLIIGMMGYLYNNREQQKSYLNLLHEGKKKRKTYIDENPSERFFVDESLHTKIKDISAGRMTKRLVKDEEIKIRSISELLKDDERNPKRYEIEDLSWGIQYGNKFVTVNVPEGSIIYPPKDTGSNMGSVFLLAKSANGNYIPFYIKPVNLNELKESDFKKRVMSALSDLASPDHAIRYKALEKLSQWLYLTNDNINIKIGTEKNPVVTLVFNGKETVLFNLNDPAFDSQKMINKILELNPRVNITTTVLSDPTLLKMYDEAGVFTTDIAKIGTSNASYNVYAIDADGKPIITPVIATESPTLEAKSDLARANMKKEHSVQIGKEVYRERDGKWYDATDKVVNDSKLLEQIEYSSKIWSMDLDPVKVVGIDKIFIISNDKDNPVCVTQRKDGKIIVMSKDASLNIINEANSKGAEKSRQERLKAEVKKGNEDYLENLNEEEKRKIASEGEEVNWDISSKKEIETQQQDETPQQTEAQKRAENIVNEITSDSSAIVLSEDGTYYLSNGKRYARVTSVIFANEESSSERFDKNSPWALPSSVIGTGIDVFVRDFFDDKIIDGEDLAKRYPNATTEQLQEFAEQLKALKSDFRRKGLTIVPKGVTVTGTIEVKTKDGTKKVLDVAGTLDLLAYDRDGNFYIFDMKTNRSAPTGEFGTKKTAKWSKQLSLYKQLLERKYGLVVKGLEIIPIEVNYPVPEGYGNGTTKYTSKNDKLYADGKEYRNAKPTLHNNIPLKEVPISIDYSSLTPVEQEMTRTIEETPATTPVTTSKKDKAPIVQSGIDKTAESIERAEKKSLAELQSDKKLNTFDDIMNSEKADEVFDILTNKFKDFPQDKIDEMITYLENKGIAVIGITDVDKWIEMIEECK